MCSFGDDPSPRGPGRLAQTFAEHPLQFGLHLKVLQSALDGDDQVGKSQVPILMQHLDDLLWRRGVRESYVLVGG